MSDPVTTRKRKPVLITHDALAIDARARTGCRVVLAILVFVLSLWIARDFLAPVGWAVLITVATWPIYLRFAEAIPGKREGARAPLIFTLLTGLLLFFPHRSCGVPRKSRVADDHPICCSLQGEWYSRPCVASRITDFWRNDCALVESQPCRQQRDWRMDRSK